MAFDEIDPFSEVVRRKLQAKAQEEEQKCQSQDAQTLAETNERVRAFEVKRPLQRQLADLMRQDASQAAVLLRDQGVKPDWIIRRRVVETKTGILRAILSGRYQYDVGNLLCIGAVKSGSWQTPAWKDVEPETHVEYFDSGFVLDESGKVLSFSSESTGCGGLRDASRPGNNAGFDHIRCDRRGEDRLRHYPALDEQLFPLKKIADDGIGFDEGHLQHWRDLLIQAGELSTPQEL